MSKRIFLTGASSGIGQATATLLVARGHEVWGTSRDPERAEMSARVHKVRLDLSETRALGESFTAAWRESGGFDVMINNAGSGHFGPAELMTPELLREQFQTLVFAHVELCRLAFAAMRARGSGLIINVTSLASRLPVPFMAAYNAAKAAMASFTMTLQLELPNDDVRVIDLQPGDIHTRFNDVMQRAAIEDSHYAAGMKRALQVANRNMEKAPKPELVARRIAELIEQKNPPTRVTVADPFQAKIAPAIFALLPPRMRVWSLRNYYKI